MRIVIDGDQFQMVEPDGRLRIDRFALDPTRRAIDLYGEGADRGEEKLFAGIYQLTANRLVLCLAGPGSPRPKDMESTRINLEELLILERE
jgi:uncharacterized protein (TIGR03067 family)